MGSARDQGRGWPDGGGKEQLMPWSGQAVKLNLQPSGESADPGFPGKSLRIKWRPQKDGETGCGSLSRSQ